MATDAMLNVRISQEFMDELDELAERVGMTRSEIVRCCLASGLGQGQRHLQRLRSPVWRLLARLAVNESGDPDQLALFDQLTRSEPTPGQPASA